MKKIIVIICAVVLCVMLCGCFDNGHYYSSYGRTSLDTFLEHYSLSEIMEYVFDYYSMDKIVDEIGRDTIMEYVESRGWIDDWNADNG